MAKDGEVMLQPGDNLTVHFREAVSLEELEAKGHVSDDVSLQRLRSSDPTSIYDCFEAFTQRSVLHMCSQLYLSVIMKCCKQASRKLCHEVLYSSKQETSCALKYGCVYCSLDDYIHDTVRCWTSTIPGTALAAAATSVPRKP